MDHKKTAEIWMEFDEAYREKEAEAFRDQQELLENLLWLERWTQECDRLYPPDHIDVPDGELHLVISDGMIPVSGLVRIYPREGRMADRIPAIRLIAGEDGRAECRIQAGQYHIEVTRKGFCRWYSEILIEPGKSLEEKAILTALTDRMEGWIPGDLHHHSIYSSPVYGGTDPVTETPEQVRKSMKAAGCEFGALSDHHNVLNHKEWVQESRPGFCPLLSKEISTSNGHVAALGVSRDVIYEIPKGEERTPEKLREEFLRICGQIKDLGGIPVLNHPFDTSKSTSWPEEMNDILPIFSAMEIWNGAHPMLKTNGNGKALELWMDLWRQGIPMTAVAGSDTHNITGCQFDHDARKICTILEGIKKNKRLLPEAYLGKASVLEAMKERSLPYFLDWIGKKLGSGCVVTYAQVKVERKPLSTFEFKSAEADMGYKVERKPFSTSEFKSAEADMGYKVERKPLSTFEFKSADADMGYKDEITYYALQHAFREKRCFITDGPLLFISAAREKASRDSRMITVEACLVTEEPKGSLCLFFHDGSRIEKPVSELEKTGSREYTMTFRYESNSPSGWVAGLAETEQSYLAAVNPVFY